LVITRDAVLTTEGTTVSDIGGIGLLQDSAPSAHTNLQVLRCARAGIWVQNTFAQDSIPALKLGGDSRLEDNGGLGLFLRDFSGLDLDGTRIADTRERQQPSGEAGIVTLGDGVQMVGASGQLNMVDTVISGNTRVGWVFDGTGAAPFSFVGPVEINRGSLVDISNTNGFISQNSDAALGTIFNSGDLAAPDFAESDAEAFQVGLRLQVLETLSLVSGVGARSGGLVGEQGLVDREGRPLSVALGDIIIVVENGD
ncbi:MAG: hypothetical protein AAFS10_27615, partial [Myxococcota bacterium]